MGTQKKAVRPEKEADPKPVLSLAQRSPGPTWGKGKETILAKEENGKKTQAVSQAGLWRGQESKEGQNMQQAKTQYSSTPEKT